MPVSRKKERMSGDRSALSDKASLSGALSLLTPPGGAPLAIKNRTPFIFVVGSPKGAAAKTAAPAKGSGRFAPALAGPFVGAPASTIRRAKLNFSSWLAALPATKANPNAQH